MSNNELQNTQLLKVGTRIKFVKDLIGEADGDHPSFLYASKGEEGCIVEQGNCKEGYWVKTDRCKASFGASHITEFVEVEGE